MRSVPEEAFKVHGFSEKFLQDKETFDQIADDFLKFIKDKKIIIHNSLWFRVFRRWTSIIEKKKIEKIGLGSLELARNKFPGTSNSLDSLCKRFNIDLSKRRKHNALLDCDLLREVYINLLDAKEPKFNLSNNTSDQNFNKTNNYNKSILKISDHELKKHKDFLKSELKKNFYWNFFIL